MYKDVKVCFGVINCQLLRNQAADIVFFGSKMVFEYELDGMMILCHMAKW